MTAPGELLLGVFLGALAFASLGVLLASPATEAPSQVLMLSNLTRLPLIFISGVFLPLHEMPDWARLLAPLSPLSYSADLIRSGFGEAHYFGAGVSAVALLVFTAAFLLLARRWHVGAREKGY